MKYIRYFAILTIVVVTSCDDFVQIDPPRTALVKNTVFADDNTADAAMLDLYYQLTNSSFASGTAGGSISFWGTYLSDEQINYYQSGISSSDAAWQQFNDNEIEPNNGHILSLWRSLYNTLYKANAIIEGVSSGELTDDLEKRLKGEAKFVRAFCHFYLTNFWGDVPLVTTTDYRDNASISRTERARVYDQIIADLIDARDLLPVDHTLSNSQRVRVTRGAANAFLARVYLYLENWNNAEMYATEVIDNSSIYTLEPIGNIFLTTSKEAILQWWSQFRPYDRSAFRVASTPSLGALRPSFATSISSSDQRSAWVNLNASGYYNARKYTSAVDLPAQQFSTVFRLSEQYLIRAEARANQNNFSGAQADINRIRTRAGLSNTSANDQASLLLAIMDERKFELFTEWGHRWFDLVRTNRGRAVLSPIKPQWEDTDILLPIPEQEIKNNPGLAGSQNPGY